MMKTLIMYVASVSLLASAVHTNKRADGIQSYGSDTISQQYCTGETFRPRCSEGKNDVIVMMSAHYGRMSFGRCIEEDPEFGPMKDNPKFIGCSSDVKHQLDQQCSGLSECDVRINNQNFDGIKPCLPGLQMYLLASYACIQVAAESRQCTVPLTTEPQHIVGGNRTRRVQTDTVDCGSESHPWLIETLVGQRIAVSLIKFGRSLDTSPARNTTFRPSTSCRTIYGFVIDRNSRSNVTICGDQMNGLHGKLDESIQTTVHKSQANSLQIFTRSDSTDKFILRVEAVGCSDLAPSSDDAFLKRVDDQITIRCYMSRQSWQLNCINGVWTGTVGVCSSINEDEQSGLSSNDENAMVQRESSNYSRSSTTEMAALVAVASAGVAVCCLVICVGVLCLRRQQRRAEKDCDNTDDINLHNGREYIHPNQGLLNSA